MNDINTLLNNLTTLICDAKDLDPATFNPDAPLVNYQLDSIDYVELMIVIKRDYQFELSADIFINNPMITARELCQQLLEGKQGK